MINPTAFSWQTLRQKSARSGKKIMTETNDGFVLSEKDLELAVPVISSKEAKRDA